MLGGKEMNRKIFFFFYYDEYSNARGLKIAQKLPTDQIIGSISIILHSWTREIDNNTLPDIVAQETSRLSEYFNYQNNNKK